MRIASLHVYPIKSCRGIELAEASFGRRGIDLDRRFMVVSGGNGFRTQRKDPLLATVQVDLAGDVMRVSAAGHGSFAVDLGGAHEGSDRRVTVWRNTSRSADQGDEAATFFTDLLGAESRLVYMPDDVERRVTRKLAVTPSDIVGYADSSPFLITASSSLVELQEHMAEPVPMDRFRPNVVVNGSEPWAEDHWSELTIGGSAVLRITKACKRCVITSTDQRTGARLREPLPALASLRRSSEGNGVEFGMYAVPAVPGGTLRVGDPIRATTDR